MKIHISLKRWGSREGSVISEHIPADVQRWHYIFFIILVNIAAKICCKDVGWFSQSFFFFFTNGAIRLYLKKIFNKIVHMQFKVGKNVGLPSSYNNKKLTINIWDRTAFYSFPPLHHFGSNFSTELDKLAVYLIWVNSDHPMT